MAMRSRSWKPTAPSLPSTRPSERIRNYQCRKGHRFPHLKRGAIRDFMDIMRAHRYFRDERWNATDCIYTFETGSKLEFFSADQPAKTRGPRRDRLFINEANNVPYETFDQLEVRTREFVFLDWNPTTEYWFYDRVRQMPAIRYTNTVRKATEMNAKAGTLDAMQGMDLTAEEQGPVPVAVPTAIDQQP